MDRSADSRIRARGTTEYVFVVYKKDFVRPWGSLLDLTSDNSCFLGALLCRMQVQGNQNFALSSSKAPYAARHFVMRPLGRNVDARSRPLGALACNFNPNAPTGFLRGGLARSSLHTSNDNHLSERRVHWGRCLTWHLRFSAALQHIDVGCKFSEIGIAFSVAQRHSTPHAVLSRGCFAERLKPEASYGALRRVISVPALRRP